MEDGGEYDPDALLEGAIDVPLGPEARYEQSESISLALVTALQVLPPRQLAVLVLCDFLGFHANEVGAGAPATRLGPLSSGLAEVHELPDGGVGVTVDDGV